LSRGKWRACGSIWGKKDRGIAVIKISLGETPYYFIADLNAVLEALTGRRNYAKLYRKT